jgi:CBS domain-containing protein/sporulation protein YlmC with PRC-barrel domain
MTSLTTFYLSRIIGKKVYDNSGNFIGVVKDLLVDNVPASEIDSSDRALVSGIKLKIRKEIKSYFFTNFNVSKINGKIKVNCDKLNELTDENIESTISLLDSILDKQIVDLNGRKLVRVNDVRLVTISEGTFAIAVDIGMEGLLRRIGIAKPIKSVLDIFNVALPAQFILWDDVQAIDFSNLHIKLSKSYKKLKTLHPSDLADIIEELGKQSSASVFSSLDEEQAADVLEELEPYAQVQMIESLPLDKAADLLEKMPADEAADLLDELEEDKAESLLREMESESSQEVRELLEYHETLVGSIMSTEILTFSPKQTVEEVINEIRDKKPEAAELYNLFVTNKKEELIGTFSLRDLIVASPQSFILQIMKPEPVCLYDDQKVNEIAEVISKYNLLAIPVVDENNLILGMVVIDDVVDDLVNERRTYSRWKIA